jgi:transcriptional regulator with XRE-family HTH domain/tetratricopeptide (TPR) repeat protein
MTEREPLTFAALLKRLRTEAGLSQEELADLAGVSVRTVSDLERGLSHQPRRDTAQLLGNALRLDGQALAEFGAAAGWRLRDRALRATAESVSEGSGGDPGRWLNQVVTALDDLGVAAARLALERWRSSAPIDDAWLTWADELITLTAEGRMQPIADRPLPVVRADPLLGREEQDEELDAFLERVKQGRGGLALVHGPSGIGKSHLLGKFLGGRSGGIRVDWATFDRDEAGYRGWRRLLKPLWIALRRTALPPAALLAHAAILDDILLTRDDGDLTTRRFPREVGAAVAALLDHVAIHKPLVLVIDDAHCGGATSDQLMLDVAREVSACPVGIIAALRPDEVEDISPIRSHINEAQDRDAPDVVVPIGVPPLDSESTARMVMRLTDREPPPKVIDEVTRQTGGRPQLIKNTPVRAPADWDVTGAWEVGKLGVEGLRVLESTIQSRPEATREVLYAAALCAVGGYTSPGFLARVTELPIEEIEGVLDDERQRDCVLTAHIPGYRFQHDNWIEAIIGLCPAPRLRALHARCLAAMQDDSAPDPHRLAQHAVGAGAGLIGEPTLAALTKRAADLSFADYAFGRAAELYTVAAENSAGTDRIDLLISQADALRFHGAWANARDALKAAVTLARSLQIPTYEARALIHLERLTWTYGLSENQLTQELRNVLSRLRDDDVELRVQTQAALAMRLSIAAHEYDDEPADLATSARQHLSAVSDPLTRADCLLGIRAGLQDSATPQELLDYAKQITQLGYTLHSGFHIDEGLSVLIIDLIRCGRLTELPGAVRDHRHFAEQSAAAVVNYGQAMVEGMLELARGEFKAAASHTDRARMLSSEWGESIAGEALMAQAGWLLYETGEVAGLADFLIGLPSHDISAINGPLWSLAAGLIYAEQGDVESAIDTFKKVYASTGCLADLPRGPSRIAILAAAAMVIGHPALIDYKLPSGEAAQIGSHLARLLIDHQDVLVLAGWPAVLLGSKQRFVGLAQLAAGQPAVAAEHLAQAAEANKDFRALHARTLFDLARTLLRQPRTNPAGVTQMQRARQLAFDLQMTTLVAQADSQLATFG